MANERQHIKLLIRAVQTGDIAEIERILELGVYINADEGGNINAKSLYRNMLMLAVDALEEEAAITLINKGVNLNHRYWGVDGKQSARDLASENGLEQVVQLIDSLLPVSQQLFYAVCDGKLERVKGLINHIDADANMKVDLYGDKMTGTAAYTLLLLAIRNGHEDVAIFLVGKGIDINFKHQVWDRYKPDEEPVLVESYDALKLAAQRNMHNLEQILMNKQNNTGHGHHQKLQQNIGFTNHERKELVKISASSNPQEKLVEVKKTDIAQDNNRRQLSHQMVNEENLHQTHEKGKAWDTPAKSHACCLIV